MDYKPHAYTREFHRSTCRLRGAFAGRRGGKTMAGDIEDLYWMDTGRCLKCISNMSIADTPGVLNRDKHGLHCPRCKMRITNKSEVKTVWGALVAPTYDDLESVHMPFFRQVIPVHRVKHWPNRQAMYLELTNGSRLDLLSAHNNEQAIGHGMKYDFIHIDEARDIRKFKLLWNTIRPTLTDYKGFAWATTTTNGKDEPYNIFYKNAGYICAPLDQLSLKRESPIVKINPKGNPNIALFTWRTIDNPYVPMGEVVEAKETMTEQMWRQEYFATVEQFRGLIYPDLCDKHYYDVLPDDGPFTWFVGYDDSKSQNGTAAAVLVAEDCHNNLYIHDEAMTKGGTVEEIARNIKEMLKRNSLEVEQVEIFVADPSIQATERSADHKGLNIQEEFAEYGIPFTLANNTVRPGIERMTHLIRNTVYNEQRAIEEKRPALCVNNRCTHWREESGKYIYKENSSDDDGLGGEIRKAFDHFMDASRYVAMARPDWFDKPMVDKYNRAIKDDNDMFDLEGDDWGDMI